MKKITLVVIACALIMALGGCSTKLFLIGLGFSNSEWMSETTCYKITNKLVKKHAKKNNLVYQIVAYYRYPLTTVIWYFEHNRSDGNILKINIIDDTGKVQEFSYEYPYDLQWLWNIKHHDWPDSLLMERRNDRWHPKDFRNVPEMRVIAEDKAVVYDSTYITIKMPTYALLEQYGAKLDSLSPIYKTYHESYEHFVYPIVDSLMSGKPEGDINLWKGY